MSSFLADTSALVAAFSGWHRHHVLALEALNRRVADGQRMVVASHSLVEVYSVLTRLPAPHRLSPAAAMALLERNLALCPAVALSSEAYLATLRNACANQVAGGSIYDALIVAAACQVRARWLLTLNPSDFRRLAPPDLEVVSLLPG